MTATASSSARQGALLALLATVVIAGVYLFFQSAPEATLCVPLQPIFRALRACLEKDRSCLGNRVISAPNAMKSPSRTW